MLLVYHREEAESLLPVQPANRQGRGISWAVIMGVGAPSGTLAQQERVLSASWQQQGEGIVLNCHLAAHPHQGMNTS